MAPDMLSPGQFGGMDNLIGMDGSSGSDMTGLGGDLGSSGMPSPVGAGSSSFPSDVMNGGMLGGY